MNSNSNLKILAATFCDVILIDSFLRMRNLFSAGADNAGRSAFVWLAAALLIFAVNALFLRRERSMTAVIIVNMILAVPEIIAVGRSFLPLNGLWAYLFLAVGLAFVHIRLVNRFFEPVTIDAHIRFFEMSVIGYLICMGMQAYSGSVGNIGVQLFIALVVALAAVICGRIEGAGNADAGAGRQGLSVVFGILGCAAAACAVFALFFSDPAGSLIGGLIAAAVRLLRAVGRALTALLEWVFSLFPAPELYPVNMEAPSVAAMPEMPTAAETNGSLFVVLAAAAAVAAAVCLCWILFRLRKTKAGRTGTVRRSRAVSRRGMPLLDSLRLMLRSAACSVTDFVRLQRIRNTPAGIILRVERGFRRGPAAKQPGETHSGYIRRLADLIADSGAAGVQNQASGNQDAEPHGAEKYGTGNVQAGRNGAGSDQAMNEDITALASKLRRLAEEFDRQFYAGESPAVYTGREAGSIKTEVQRVMQRKQA